MVGLAFIPVNFFKLAFLACFIFSCLSLGTPSQACDPNDLLALREFAGNLTNGSIITTWSNDSICCEWEGVKCDHGGNGSSTSRVIILNISGKGLRGSISRSLGSLDELKLLDLSYNHLDGELPTELSNLKNLEVLDFSHNMLTGPVSGSLVGLNSIRSINISCNSFNGDLFDLGEFPNLSVLNLSSNSFAGGLNSQICISSNKIQILDLSMNHLSGGLDGLGNYSTSLQQLRVDGNSLEGQIPDSLYSASSLEHLSISANNFSGQLSPKLSKLRASKSWTIASSKLYLSPTNLPLKIPACQGHSLSSHSSQLQPRPQQSRQ